jgi:hypothetical protein
MIEKEAKKFHKLSAKGIEGLLRSPEFAGKFKISVMYCYLAFRPIHRLKFMEQYTKLSKQEYQRKIYTTNDTAG